jgi:hypothetical protein
MREKKQIWEIALSGALLLVKDVVMDEAIHPLMHKPENWC